MPRFKVTCEYEGTRFSGWQVQKNARTVQGELIGASKSIFNTDAFELYGSGRTDAGVHALEQIFHLDVETMLAPQIIQFKMNDALPADISVRSIQKVAKQFHARHDAVERTYLYQISTRRTAFGKRFVWWVKDQLSVAAMQEAAKHFKGMHDFRSFTADDPDMKSTKVEITEVSVKMQGDLIMITISGSHFLWNMIRRMIGVMVEVGRGKQSPDIIPTLLKKKSDMPASFTAPPSGLFLASVRYEDDPVKKVQPILNVT